MTLACRLLTLEEFSATEDARRTAVTAWKEAHPAFDYAKAWPPELSALNAAFRPPGTMWFCPWYHDPQDPEDMAHLAARRARAAAADFDGHLSIHYLTDWADKRAPIAVICPGGSEWVVDAKSTNGTGWTVTGAAPLITCNPSIVVPGYHGWLQNGVFSNPV